MHARKNKEGGNQMKDNELLFDRKSHVLYSKPCKKEILAKIALHYLEAERETVWEKANIGTFNDNDFNKSPREKISFLL